MSAVIVAFLTLVDDGLVGGLMRVGGENTARRTPCCGKMSCTEADIWRRRCFARR